MLNVISVDPWSGIIMIRFLQPYCQVLSPHIILHCVTHLNYTNNTSVNRIQMWIIIILLPTLYLWRRVSSLLLILMTLFCFDFHVQSRVVQSRQSMNYFMGIDIITEAIIQNRIDSYVYLLLLWCNLGSSGIRQDTDQQRPELNGYIGIPRRLVLPPEAFCPTTSIYLLYHRYPFSNYYWSQSHWLGAFGISFPEKVIVLKQTSSSSCNDLKHWLKYNNYSIICS